MRVCVREGVDWEGRAGGRIREQPLPAPMVWDHECSRRRSVGQRCRHRPKEFSPAAGLVLVRTQCSAQPMPSRQRRARRAPLRPPAVLAPSSSSTLYGQSRAARRGLRLELLQEHLLAVLELADRRRQLRPPRPRPVRRRRAGIVVVAAAGGGGGGGVNALGERGGGGGHHMRMRTSRCLHAQSTEAGAHLQLPSLQTAQEG